MSKLNEVEINLCPTPSHEFLLKINGYDIKYVTSVTIKSDVKEYSVPVVQIEILASKITGKIKGKTKIIAGKIT